ncbi:MAG: UDP-N-acetylmuramoyl-L-alanine--D-glutamate ligase [Gemmatimonadales bacterium]|nr:UDP-N-acetylmuramoyl-L-alanine--D-glutamate ligase [Gemmatimonadales bacterium]
MNRIERWRASGAEVSVAGLGRSGLAAARLLGDAGIAVYASDASPKASGGAPIPGVTVEVGRHDLERIRRSAALIVSPGIPPDAEVVASSRAAGVEIVAEAQLGLDHLGGIPQLMVTGTNGKTTTTALLDHVMRAAGRNSVAAGNIGTPLAAVAIREVKPAWLAVELSSFQLHDMPDVRPTVGVLTNLAPDHLDRYPGLDAYYADKALLFANATGSSIWVTNLDDPASRSMVAAVRGRHLTFSVAHGVRADGWFDRDADLLMLAGRPLLPRAELALLGDHNVANALAAALALHVTAMSHDEIAGGLRTFAALPHRMEPIVEVNGVLWINDSKATNVASTAVALQAMTRPYVVMLGGRHKGEPYTALATALRARAHAVVAYGEAAGLITTDLADVIPVLRGSTFDEAMELARGRVPAGGAVLLSPACSSYDMFNNYEERGARFRTIVEAW